MKPAMGKYYYCNDGIYRRIVKHEASPHKYRLSYAIIYNFVSFNQIDFMYFPGQIIREATLNEIEQYKRAKLENNI